MAELYGNRWRPTGVAFGEGGQAHAIEVLDETGAVTERAVLKKLKNQARIGRFEQEIKALSGIASSHTPRILDYGLDEPRPYVVMPYVGQSLLKHFATNRTSWALTMNVAKATLQAVDDATKAGVVAHRDIKPDNVTIDSDGHIWLIDFGICQFQDGEGYTTVVDEAFGHRAFAAPECESGSTLASDSRGDVYSIGKLIYWVVTGGRTIARERLNGLEEFIPQATGVEAGHVMMLMRGMVVEPPGARWMVETALKKVNAAETLAAMGQNAVGYEHQLCVTCREDYMSPVTPSLQIFSNLQPENELKLLCNRCGAFRVHLLDTTTAARWAGFRAFQKTR